MDMKKLILSILVAATLVFSFTACGQDNKNTASFAGPTEPQLKDKNGVGFFETADGTLSVTTADKNAKVITVPETFNKKKVTKLSKSAFKMSKAEKIVLPDSLETINDYAFAFCRNLKEIKLPSKIKKIGQNSFSGCESLKTIKIPDKVKSIGIFAFNGSGLETITIPKNVKLIQGFAFAECESLKEVRILSESTQIEQKAFNDSPDAVIIAPKNSEAVEYAKKNTIAYKTK